MFAYLKAAATHLHLHIQFNFIEYGIEHMDTNEKNISSFFFSLDVIHFVLVYQLSPLILH